MVGARTVGIAAATLALCAGCSASTAARHPASDRSSTPGHSASTTFDTAPAATNAAPDNAGIQRATSGTDTREGHFSDPYPLSGSTDPQTPSGLVFSGTFPEIITCPGRLRPGCFTASSISVGFDTTLHRDLSRNGEKTQPATKAHHIYRGTTGYWDMIFTSKITRGNAGWNVIFHAHPATTKGSSVPTRWVADTVLVGSLERPAAANYDGKLYDDDGKLYLVYSGAVSTKPQVFGVVARRMASPSRVASAPPVTLLAPQRSDGGLNSENRFGPDQHNGFKLVETGNITKINGKYVMIYAVGAFDRPDYKIGVAYSDTFLPTGSGYRKVRMPDPAGVWGRKNAREVRYLLQSEKPAWPNYVRTQVQAPGVGSLVHTGGQWYLFFAGYAPSERTSAKTSRFDASHRQPYYLPVRLNIPQQPTVAAASDATLATWLSPQIKP